MGPRDRSAEAEAEAIINSSDESVEGLLEDTELYVGDDDLESDDEIKDLVDTFEEVEGDFDSGDDSSF